LYSSSNFTLTQGENRDIPTGVDAAMREKLVYSTTEAAQVLGVARQTIYRRAKTSALYSSQAWGKFHAKQVKIMALAESGIRPLDRCEADWDFELRQMRDGEVVRAEEA
jgi:hypothetical protein